jgi:hypothetical protein
MDIKTVDLKLSNREDLLVEGVLEVLSLKDDKIVIKTNNGLLSVLGEGLVIKKFQEGESAKITGNIKTLSFSDRLSPKGILGSLTK